MRRFGSSLVAAAVALALPCVAAAAFSYDFSALTPGTVPTANQAPPPAGASFQGSYTYNATPANIGGINTIGPDNWVWTSSTANVFSSIVRNDASPGMSGTYVSAYPTAATSATGAAPPSYDSINSRKNDANFSYSIPNGSTFRVSFIASVGYINYTAPVAAPVATSTTGRAQIGLGYDQNGDGDIRGNAANAENPEWGPIFGFEPAAVAGTNTAVGNFYIRPANLGSAKTAAAAGPGVYYIQIDIDPNANPNANTGSTTLFSGNDGKATLSAQQLFDANGLAVSAPLAAVPGLIDVNLGLTGMTDHQVNSGVPRVGTAGGWNPANWNGFFTRLSNNGSLDALTITVTPEPTTLATLGLAGVTLVRRRKFVG